MLKFNKERCILIKNPNYTPLLYKIRMITKLSALDISLREASPRIEPWTALSQSLQQKNSNLQYNIFHNAIPNR
jgi:hypothetical protein